MRSGPGRLPNRKKSTGPRWRGYSLDRVFAAANSIDTLLIGTGTGVWLPPPELRQALKAVRVVLDTMQTGPAVRTYNIMIGERRRVAAALIAVP